MDEHAFRTAALVPVAQAAITPAHSLQHDHGMLNVRYAAGISKALRTAIGRTRPVAAELLAIQCIRPVLTRCGASRAAAIGWSGGVEEGWPRDCAGRASRLGSGVERRGPSQKSQP